MSNKRTVQSYEDVQYLERNPFIRLSKGIKFNSWFNKLEFFLVCKAGLPPCLGHDLFEGIVANDLFLYIIYFNDVQWFTFHQMNRHMNKFNYGNDCKPFDLNPASVKLNGCAVQKLGIYEFFTFFCGKFIKGKENTVWLLYLKLKEIVELVCSPQITAVLIANLNICIEEYISDRKSTFPRVKLRPKHHFLCHYLELIL